jgi:hypothetical protein
MAASGLGRVKSQACFWKVEFPSQNRSPERVRHSQYSSERRDRENNSQKVLQKRIFTQPGSTAPDQAQCWHVRTAPESGYVAGAAHWRSGPWGTGAAVHEMNRLLFLQRLRRETRLSHGEHASPSLTATTEINECRQPMSHNARCPVTIWRASGFARRTAPIRTRHGSRCAIR